MGGRQGRQRWEDSIREWTGLEFAKVPEGSGKRRKMEKLVAKSSVLPQQLSQLRDRRR